MSGPVGIGIDLCGISEIRELDQRTDGVFVRHTFTALEQKLAEGLKDPYEFYAGRFAVKEAVFKAAAHLTPEKGFDFRFVETDRLPDGSPEIVINEKTRAVMEKAGISRFLVSITNQGDSAMAIVTALAD